MVRVVEIMFIFKIFVQQLKMFKQNEKFNKIKEIINIGSQSKITNLEILYLVKKLLSRHLIMRLLKIERRYCPSYLFHF